MENDVRYNFLDNNFFTIYEAPEEVHPKYRTLLFGDEDLDWADDISMYGIPIIKSHDKKEESSSEINVNNPPEVRITTPIEEQSVLSPEVKLTGGSRKKNAEFAYKYLVNNGIPKGSAAGIVGNLYNENLGNPLSVVKDAKNTTAYGIAGFNSKGWWPALEEWSGTKKPDFLKLLDFLIHIINTLPKLSALLNKDMSPEDASFIWGKEFEKFRGYTNGGRGYLNINDPEHKKRASVARTLFKQYG